MNETVSAVAELTASLKNVARWFVVITVMAIIALWTLAAPAGDEARHWLPFVLQASIICSWACSAFCILPVITGISGVVAFLAPHIDIVSFIPKALRQRPQVAIADTSNETGDAATDDGQQRQSAVAAALPVPAD